MRFACSHHDAVLQVQQLFCFFSGKKKIRSQERGQLVVFNKDHIKKKAPSGFPLHTCGRLKLLSQSFSNMSQGWIKLQDVPLLFGAARGLSIVFQSQDTTGRFSATPVDEKVILCVSLWWVCSKGEAVRTPGRTEESHGSVMRQREKKRKKLIVTKRVSV